MVAPLLPFLLLGLPAVLAAPFDNVTSSAYPTLNATAVAVTSSAVDSASATASQSTTRSPPVSFDSSTDLDPPAFLPAYSASTATATGQSPPPPETDPGQAPPAQTEPTEPEVDLPRTPFVGPTPQTRGEGAWADAVGKVSSSLIRWRDLEVTRLRRVNERSRSG